jgi:hypothetical protein
MTLYVALDQQWAVVNSVAAPSLIAKLPGQNVDQEWSVESLADQSADRNLARPQSSSTLFENNLLAFQHNYLQTRLSLYDLGPSTVSLPTHDVQYRYGPLTLLKFVVLPGTSTSPGSTLLLRTWWSASDKIDDNDIINAELITATGEHVAGDSALVAHSFTTTWSPGSTYIDQRIINIPEALDSGQYDLVVSMHGTNNATNIPITLVNHDAIGEFGYLTSVTIEKR